MNILFWVSAFPQVSETFIRNQIVDLLNEGMKVDVLCEIKKSSQDGLVGYSKYNLLGKTHSFDELYPKNKFLRVIKCLYILFGNIFSPNFVYLFRSLNYKKFGKRALRLKCFFITNYIIERRVAVIHCHFGPNGKEAAFLKEIGLDIKIICTFHGYDIRIGNENGGQFYSNLFKHIDYVIAISEYNKFNLISFGLESNKIISLNNGVELRKCLKKREYNSKNIIKIISVGRLVKDKGYHLALNAFKLILEKHPRLEYHIIGDGVLRIELMELANSLGIKDKVIFHLARESQFVIDMMLESDIFLLSSINEALPTVILEAFSCCLPVVATDVGSVKEIVKDDVTGFLVRPEIGSIYRGLDQILSQPNLWGNFARAGKLMVEEEYNNVIQMKKLIKIYNE